MMNVYRTAIVAMIFILSACENAEHKPNAKDSVVVVQKKPTVQQFRTKVASGPVAKYSKPIQNSDLQGNFSVSLFETNQTFHYLMKIKYAEFDAEDTLKLPNFGMEPKPGIRATAEPNSCIVGFYDDTKTFREYKLVQVKNDRVKIKALHHYAVATFQN